MNLHTDMQLVAGLIGGILIGLSALILLLGNGRIAGISGIAGGALNKFSRAETWRWCFIVGLVVGAALFGFFSGGLKLVLPPVDMTLVIAAILVGVGTRLGSGCTSGHGVCGIGRLSKRSIIATIIFMTTAIITVAITGAAA